MDWWAPVARDWFTFAHPDARLAADANAVDEAFQSLPSPIREASDSDLENMESIERYTIKDLNEKLARAQRDVAVITGERARRRMAKERRVSA